MLAISRGFGDVIEKRTVGLALYVPSFRCLCRFMHRSIPLRKNDAALSFHRTPLRHLFMEAYKASAPITSSRILFSMFIVHLAPPGVMSIIEILFGFRRGFGSLRQMLRGSDALHRFCTALCWHNPGRTDSRSWRCCCWRCLMRGHTTDDSRRHDSPSANGSSALTAYTPYSYPYWGEYRLRSLSRHPLIRFLVSTALPVQKNTRLLERWYTL